MKDFKFDSEGKLIFDDSLKEVTDLERIEIAKLERQYKTVIPDVNPTDEFVRTLPGIASRVITESVDLANLLTETTSLEKKAGKFLFGKEGAKKIEELNQEIKNRRSKKLTNFYNTVFGERNIEQEERIENFDKKHVGNDSKRSLTGKYVGLGIIVVLTHIWLLLILGST